MTGFRIVGELAADPHSGQRSAGCLIACFFLVKPAPKVRALLYGYSDLRHSSPASTHQHQLQKICISSIVTSFFHLPCIPPPHQSDAIQSPSYCGPKQKLPNPQTRVPSWMRYQSVGCFHPKHSPLARRGEAVTGRQNHLRKIQCSQGARVVRRDHNWYRCLDT